MPAAPTSLTLNQPTALDPLVTLSWAHTNTDLDRFEVLYKRTDLTTWHSYIVAPKGDFGSGPYSIQVGTSPSYQWAVRALNAAGTVSTTNPTVTFSGEVDGLWLVPFSGTSAVTSLQSWMGGETPAGDSERSVEVFTIPTRPAKVSQAGALHLDEGEIAGWLMERHGRNAHQWLDRLRRLVNEQHRYDVWLVTPRHFIQVELNGLSRTTLIAGGQAWSVGLPYRQVA